MEDEVVDLYFRCPAASDNSGRGKGFGSAELFIESTKWLSGSLAAQPSDDSG